MNKVIRIGTVPTHNGRRISVFCRIEYKSGRLSISGVEGPTHSGNAHGGCGQIVMHLRDQVDTITPAPGWTREMLVRFFEVWDEWHLNDMRAYDAEMQAAAWDKSARKAVLGYEFDLKSAVSDQQRKLKERAEAALKQYGTASYTPEEQAVMNLPYSVVLWVAEGEAEPAAPDHYERSKHAYGGNGGNIKQPERKTLGWLRPEEHPEGLLGRRLRPDGPAYGSDHFKHPVPQDVLDFLQSLPCADKQPAWV